MPQVLCITPKRLPAMTPIETIYSPAAEHRRNVTPLTKEIRPCPSMTYYAACLPPMPVDRVATVATELHRRFFRALRQTWVCRLWLMRADSRINLRTIAYRSACSSARRFAPETV